MLQPERNLESLLDLRQQPPRSECLDNRLGASLDNHMFPRRQTNECISWMIVAVVSPSFQGIMPLQTLAWQLHLLRRWQHVGV